MGDAKRRGSFEQRKAEAIEAGRTPGTPERTTPYKRYLKLSTPALDFLEIRYIVLDGKTIGELQAEIAAQRKALSGDA
jgi:hypothetical protein